MTKHITIIGAGWLGLPLSHHLSDSCRVFASKTTPAGADALKLEGIRSFCFDFEQSEHPLAETLTAQNAEIVIGCFPPGFRQNKQDEYAHYWRYLVEQCKIAQVKKLVMISTTGVYPSHPGIMTEQDASLMLAQANADFSESARILLTAEQHVIDSGLDYTILRFSGLIGPKRHPARFVPKLKQVSSLAPANMLHLDDAIGCIRYILEQELSGIFNVTTPQTVSKAEFYQAALDSVSSEADLPPVVAQEDKRVSSDKLCHCGYQFHYQNTLDTLRYL
ncbi:NAD(P)H-binding protein [Vibrio ruber]|uniref:NAD(P)H-binding protein n=1 Tax=Vibrio ruber TaxID=184755 RepID=UPI002892E82E|nr:NAD(P)H-binding protein [Vibrio ruber]WNJ94949.1 NAD(P)H-binding protein [Vibrio ruber]